MQLLLRTQLSSLSVYLLTAWLAKLLLLRTQLSVLAQHQFFLYIIIVSLPMTNVWKIKFHIYESITIKVIYFIYDLEKLPLKSTSTSLRMTQTTN